MDPVPMLCGLLVQRRHAAAETGVVAQDIKPPKPLLGCRDHALDVFLLRHIAMYRYRPVAGSRGNRTFSAPAATQTAPNSARPIERSMTTPNRPSQPGAATAGRPNTPVTQPGGFFGRGMLGGLAVGIFGLVMLHHSDGVGANVVWGAVAVGGTLVAVLGYAAMRFE